VASPQERDPPAAEAQADAPWPAAPEHVVQPNGEAGPIGEHRPQRRGARPARAAAQAAVGTTNRRRPSDNAVALWLSSYRQDHSRSRSWNERDPKVIAASRKHELSSPASSEKRVDRRSSAVGSSKNSSASVPRVAPAQGEAFLVDVLVELARHLEQTRYGGRR